MAAALAASNPTLYRHLALYLQVLRQVLPARVEQACFHLATQVHPQRYAALPAQERQGLHGRLLALVQRCSSLLTVEQLTALADQIDRETQHRQRRQQRELLEQLTSGAADDDSEDDDPDTDHDEAALERAQADPALDPGLNPDPAALPAGSIRLDFSLPLSGNWRSLPPPGSRLTGLKRPNDADSQSSPHPADPGADSPESGASGAGGAVSGQGDAAAEAGVAGEGFETSGGENSGSESRFPDTSGIADQEQRDDEHRDDDASDDVDDGGSGPDAVGPDRSAIDREAEEPAAESLQQRLAQGPDAAEILKIVREAMDDSRDRGRQDSPFSDRGASSPWRDATLPRDPVTLLRWLDGVDKALLRRLRNLSHALNVELLRVGISRGLLPVSLLDAVLEGQVDSMASPSNVLHLQMPIGLSPGTAEVHALAILLRPVDLEMDEPRLRTCRRRLQQQRQELRRMAHQFRRLQRRLQAHEAERLWLQDIRNSRPPQA